MQWLVQTGGASLQPSNYWKVERRLEQDECIISRMKIVAAGGVLVWDELFNKGQSHQLLCILIFFYYYYYGLTQASVFFFSSVDFPAFIVRFTLGTLTLEESRRRTGRYRKLPEKRWKLMVHFDPLKERSIKQMDAFNTVFLKCLASLLKKQ